MHSTKTKKFLDDLKAKGITNYVFAAVPNENSDLTGEIIAINGNKLDVISLICAIITVISDDDKDQLRTMEMITDALDAAKDDVNELRKEREKMKDKVTRIAKDVLSGN